MANECSFVLDVALMRRLEENRWRRDYVRCLEAEKAVNSPQSEHGMQAPPFFFFFFSPFF